jgi:pilus assembly protein Flp/PilA
MIAGSSAMPKQLSIWKRLIREEDGPTAVEYAIMLALILGVIFVSIALMGTETGELYESMGTDISDAMGH